MLFRTLQVLGAYGFRGYFERKKHFLDSIPPAIQNLRDLWRWARRCSLIPIWWICFADLPNCRSSSVIESAALTRADGYRLQTIISIGLSTGWTCATFSKYDGKGPLVVRVYSFSFRKGIPEDPSGNGGGYVFDCRVPITLASYEPYKKLTGLDEPVIRFLEDDGEISDQFLDACLCTCRSSREPLYQRGFTSLMFCFGCTGGQHRSVYSAQHLAEHIHREVWCGSANLSSWTTDWAGFACKIMNKMACKFGYLAKS